MSSKPIFEKYFVTLQGFSVGPTTDWEKHPLWDKDPVMLPFRSAARTGRLMGYAGPSSRQAAEVLSKYIIVDMFAKAVQGMPAEDAVKWAEAEVSHRHGGLHRGASSQSQTSDARSRRPADAGEIRAAVFQR
jgi:multiple sugar transport system substrate-binding protein